MLMNVFCCPICKKPPTPAGTTLACKDCDRTYEIADGIPDFFIEAADSCIHDDDPNRKWLAEDVADGRDLSYRYCTRKLKGMTFCMEEIGRRAFPGCRILEVGMGTGHFTRWLSEASGSDGEVYAFDFSLPLIQKAIANTQDCPGVTLFRANARGSMPFKPETFDILFQRLGPFSPSGSTQQEKLGRVLEQLKPCGWFFYGGWTAEWCTLEDLVESGFTNVEHHRWQYPYVYEDEEHLGLELEAGRTAEEAQSLIEERKREQNRSHGWEALKGEHLLIAQKPEAC